MSEVNVEDLVQIVSETQSNEDERVKRLGELFQSCDSQTSCSWNVSFRRASFERGHLLVDFGAELLGFSEAETIHAYVLVVRDRANGGRPHLAITYFVNPLHKELRTITGGLHQQLHPDGLGRRLEVVIYAYSQNCQGRFAVEVPTS